MSVVLSVCAALGSLCAGLLAVAVWLWVTRHRTSIPGPPTLPLLGNALMFLKLPVLWDRLGELHSRYGDIFRFYVGPKLVIVLTQPEDVQSVLLTSKVRERDPYIAYVLRSFLGDGLLTTKGSLWRKHRKHIEPAFHTEELEKFMDKFNDAGRSFCELLAKCNGTEVDMHHMLLLTSLRTAATTIFDIELDEIFPGRQRQAEITTEMFDFSAALSEIIYRPWTAINVIRWMSARGREITRFNTTSNYMVYRGLSLTSKNMASKNTSGRSLLTLLEKKEGLGYTDKELYDEIVTLTAAGVDTTANTMGYVLALLGLHPEWQDQAQCELDEYFGTGGDYLRPVTTTDLTQLPVIDAIVKETLRLFPTVPCMPYLMTEDIPLAGGRFVAPQGSCVLVAYFLMHRHPQLFPEPLRFDPGRFLEGGSAANRKIYSYIPFGIGSRKCVGARYAVLQTKAVLVAVLRRYRILPGTTREELEASVISITAHPITGFRVTFSARGNIPSNSSLKRSGVDNYTDRILNIGQTDTSESIR